MTPRDRFLDVARDADDLATAARMLMIAQRAGWLSEDARRSEFVALVDARAGRAALNAADVEAVCAANAAHELDAATAALPPRPDYAAPVPAAAAFACLGHGELRSRVLLGLTASDAQDAQIAQVYLRHHPLDGADETRRLTAAVALMGDGEAQVRALDALAAMRISDRESLATLAALYPRARTAGVQRAIAGVMIRADAHALGTPDFLRALRRDRLPSAGGEDLIDVLIRRLQTAS